MLFLGLRKLVRGTAAESFLDDQVVDDDDDEDEDMEEHDGNEYNVNDDFVDDREIQAGESFYN